MPVKGSPRHWQTASWARAGRFRAFMEQLFSFLFPFNRHNERAMPDRRAGKHRQFQALYGSASSTAALLVTSAECPPGGAVGHCPARYALDSGQKRKEQWFHQRSPQLKAFSRQPPCLDSGPCNRPICRRHHGVTATPWVDFGLLRAVATVYHAAWFCRGQPAPTGVFCNEGAGACQTCD